MKVRDVPKLLSDDGWYLVIVCSNRRGYSNGRIDLQDVVALEKGALNWSAYSPDVPGCIATVRTKAQTVERFKEALKMHPDGLWEDGLPIPPSAAVAVMVEV